MGILRYWGMLFFALLSATSEPALAQQFNGAPSTTVTLDGKQLPPPFDFKYDGPGPGKGGTGVFTVDGKEVAKKTLGHTIPLLMAIDETFDAVWIRARRWTSATMCHFASPVPSTS